jgi:hypothetical protein
VLKVACGCHHLKKRSVKRQSALMRCQIGDICLSNELRFFSVGAFGITGV